MFNNLVSKEMNSIKMNMAVITFSTDGYIKNASDLFLNTMGYSIDQIEGKHHRIFCSPEESSSHQYNNFWYNLKNGKEQYGTFCRYDKSGREVFLEATYIPVKSKNGEVIEILKIANNITESYIEKLNNMALLDSLNKSTAVIEFSPDGLVITANQNFLKTMKYKAVRDIEGKHHRIFCFDSFYEKNPHFWADLASGKHMKNRFERKDSLGNVVYLEATYNPVMDSYGNVIKVVKFATDITDNVNKEKKAFATVEEASAVSTETEQIAINGIEYLQDLIKSSQGTSVTIEEAKRLINKLSEQSKNINIITETISEVANKTHLLSLNASIEAARAGDHGRGFSVVANEVRNLSKTSSENVKDIEKMLKENVELTEKTNEIMEVMVSKSIKDNEKIKNVGNIVDEILKGAQNVSSAVENLLIK